MGEAKKQEDQMEYFTYLDNLRESGVVNMFGASEYVSDEFGIPKNEARSILTDWMKAYGTIWDGENHEFFDTTKPERGSEV